MLDSDVAWDHAAMTPEGRPTIQLEDEETGKLHATWSRSGKRLTLTVERRGRYAQVELRPDQVAELARYLKED